MRVTTGVLCFMTTSLLEVRPRGWFGIHDHGQGFESGAGSGSANIKAINRLRGGGFKAAAQAHARVDAEIGQKDPFRMGRR